MDHPATSEPRRTRAAAPPSAPGNEVAGKHTGADQAQVDPASAVAKAPEFQLQELSIRRDPEIGRVVVQVVDAQTQELVRQIPSEEWVRVLRSLRGAKGLFVDRKG